jgi:hypothetical protein
MAKKLEIDKTQPLNFVPVLPAMIVGQTNITELFWNSKTPAVDYLMDDEDPTADPSDADLFAAIRADAATFVKCLGTEWLVSGVIEWTPDDLAFMIACAYWHRLATGVTPV